MLRGTDIYRLETNFKTFMLANFRETLLTLESEQIRTQATNVEHCCREIYYKNAVSNIRLRTRASRSCIYSGTRNGSYIAGVLEFDHFKIKTIHNSLNVHVPITGSFAIFRD
ncbi:unnamed protein product [Gongylonema pulchrum]|uniref:Uncharacterized protein n=1 Tax=Gongylonema pulchrum TaxID=637853 RepID=A0A183D8T2_9BILA|nr:unnamed protein product [Gongylonema pulchrum]